MSAEKPRRLGRGLEALIPVAGGAQAVPASDLQRIQLSRIRANPFQPRREFDPAPDHPPRSGHAHRVPCQRGPRPEAGPRGSLVQHRSPVRRRGVHQAGTWRPELGRGPPAASVDHPSGSGRRRVPRGGAGLPFDVDGERLLWSCRVRRPGEDLVHVVRSAESMLVAVVTRQRLRDPRGRRRLVPEVHPVDRLIDFPLNVGRIDPHNDHPLTLRPGDAHAHGLRHDSARSGIWQGSQTVVERG